MGDHQLGVGVLPGSGLQRHRGVTNGFLVRQGLAPVYLDPDQLALLATLVGDGENLAKRG